MTARKRYSAGDAPSSSPASFRAQVDRLMDVLWAGGVNNPMDSIEQLTYLIFIRLLSQRDDQLSTIDQTYKPLFTGEWARYYWGSMLPLTGAELFDTVRSAVERLHALPGLSGTGATLFRGAYLKIYDPPTLKAAMEIIDTIDLRAAVADAKGDMYEHLLTKLSQSGTNGQFRTPRHIIDMIVALVDPQPFERVCDPACGTAGFLISAYRHVVREHSLPADAAAGHIDGSQLTAAQWEFLESEAFTGFDNDANMVKISIMNLYLHQLERARIEHFNPLTTGLGSQYPGELFDVILANPPFAGRVQRESILPDLATDTRDTELLFLQWFIDHLAPGGRAGVIVPNGVLFGTSRADRRIREQLLRECRVDAVISLPAGIFRPYSGVATAVLVFQKEPPTESVWFFELRADGRSLDDKRQEIPENDIPRLLAAWPSRAESMQSFSVPVADIERTGWLLVPSRYRATEASTVDVRDPVTILSELEGLETEIAERIAALKGRIAPE